MRNEQRNYFLTAAESAECRDVLGIGRRCRCGEPIEPDSPYDTCSVGCSVDRAADALEDSLTRRVSRSETLAATVRRIVADEQTYDQCECELDWRCPLHAGQPTPLELMNHYDAQQQANLDREGGWND